MVHDAELEQDEGSMSGPQHLLSSGPLDSTNQNWTKPSLLSRLSKYADEDAVVGDLPHNTGSQQRHYGTTACTSPDGNCTKLRDIFIADGTSNPAIWLNFGKLTGHQQLCPSQ